MLDYESDDDGSDSGSSVTYKFPAFSLSFDDSVGSVSVLGSIILYRQGSSPNVILLHLTFSYLYQSNPRLVDSLKCFGAQTPCFLSKFENQFYRYIHVINSPHSILPL